MGALCPLPVLRARLSLAAVVAAIGVGLVIGNAMPVVASALAGRGGASMALLGGLITAEFLASAAAALALAPFAGSVSARLLAVTGSLVAGAAQTASAFALSDVGGGIALFAGLRIVAGLGEGALLCAANAGLARLARPARAYGLACVAASLVSAALLAGLPRYAPAQPEYGFYALTALLLAPALLYWALPEPSPGAARAAGGLKGALLRAPALALLSGCLLFAVALGGLWTFVEMIGLASGLARAAIGDALGLAMIAGLAGGAACAILGERAGLRGPWLAGAACLVGVAATIAHARDVLSFGAVQIVYGFSYFVAMTYLMSAGARLDPTGRVSAAVGGVWLVGAGLGPALGGWAIERLGPAGLGGAAAALLALSALFVAFAAPGRRGLEAAPQGAASGA